MRSVRRALRELERNELGNKGEPPINLVPMIDVLTVLVLYLLVGTIYKHLAILQLSLPSTTPVVQIQDKPPLQLTVNVLAGELVVSDRSGALKRIPNTAEGYDLAALAQFMAEVKHKAPEETSITLLLQPAILYDTLIQVMDTVRLWPAGVPQDLGTKEMFPVIAIGDAQIPATAP